MASLPVRDPVGDHLLTPQNAALLVIDYQPSQFAAVRSMDRDLLLENIVSTVKTAKAFGLPIVHSTINVATGRGQPTVPELAELLEDNPPIDRTTTQRVGGRRLPRRRARHRAAQADPVCALDRDLHGVPGARRAAGGLRRLSRRRRDRRHVARRPIAPASSASSRREAQPDQLGRPRVELQRDWAREETVADVIEIVLTERLLKRMTAEPRSPIPRRASSSGTPIRCSRG